MKVPRRITDLLNRKQEFIDFNRDKLEKSVIKIQSKLLDQINATIIPQLDVKDGLLLDTTNNYRLIGELDKVYNDFTNISSKLITAQVSGVTKGLVDMGKNYFSAVLPELGKRFENIISATAKKMNLRIGLANDVAFRGGFLDSIIKDPSLNTQIKNYIGKSVAGQIDMKEFIKGLSEIVNGDKGTGALEKQYQQYAYDIYQQYDAAYNAALSDEFGMKYFIYQNGLVVDSRDFCAAHDGKVWSKDEAVLWPKWTPSKGEYPEGYEVKAKDLYSVPGYMNYIGYQPLIDRGGYKCRHVLGYISDDLAFDLRPELKKLKNS